MKTPQFGVHTSTKTEKPLWNVNNQGWIQQISTDTTKQKYTTY